MSVGTRVAGVVHGVGPVLRSSPGLGRLLAVRFGSQWTDGLFQAALGGAVLFNPERQADPLAIAAGLAVLLLPYSLIGPFAGALLDRWDRRQVLLWANLLKSALVLVVALLLVGHVGDGGFYVAALAVAGVSRFVLSGLSAALPHVTTPERIVAVNAAVSTTGAMVAVVGAGCAVGLRALVGSGDAGSGIVVAAAALGGVVAAWVARGFRRGALGPEEPGPDDPSQASPLLAVATGWGHGAVAARRAPDVLGALIALGAHRIAFGVNTLLILLLVRHAATGSGLLGFSGFVALTALGLVLAAPVTPWLVAKVGRRTTIAGALTVAVLVELALVTTFAQLPILVAALLLSVAGQVVKLATDAAVQLGVADDNIGQVFALQDAIFNVAYVAAIALAATVVAPDGRTLGLALTAAGVYALGLAGHLAMSRRA